MAPRPRAHLARLEPYEWEASTGAVAAAAGLPASQVVRFDTNTAPWPPVGWEQTLRDLPGMAANEYPHPSNDPLRSALAVHLDVAPEQVIVTCGADEALYLVASCYLGPGRRAVLPTPSFSMFRVVTETVGGRVVPLPLDDAWRVPVESLLAAARQPGVAVIWLCSPNNPTGGLVEAETVRAVAEAAPDAVVVLDEAYCEVAGATLAPLLPHHPNLLLVRTFSKGYGLAGARVGYAVGAPRLVRTLDLVRPPQNVTAFGITAALRALQDQAGLQERVALLRAERSRLDEALRARGWDVVPSQGNFLLARPPEDPGTLGHRLQRHGLVIRTYPTHPRLRAYVRVTVRSPEENARLVALLDSRG